MVVARFGWTMLNVTVLKPSLVIVLLIPLENMTVYIEMMLVLNAHQKVRFSDLCM